MKSGAWLEGQASISLCLSLLWRSYILPDMTQYFFTYVCINMRWCWTRQSWALTQYVNDCTVGYAIRSTGWAGKPTFWMYWVYQVLVWLANCPAYVCNWQLTICYHLVSKFFYLYILISCAISDSCLFWITLIPSEQTFIVKKPFINNLLQQNG